MKRHIRAIGTGLALVLLTPGCKSRPDVTMPPEPPIAPEQTLESLIRAIKKREAGRTSLKLDCMAALASPRIRSNGWERGRLRFVRAPQGPQLRFNVSGFASAAVLDMATDSQNIWIYDPQKLTKYQGRAWAYYDEESSPGFFPDDLAEIFDIYRLLLGKHLRIFVKAPTMYQIQLVDVAKGGDLKLFRRITISRTDLSVVVYEIFNPDGSLRCQILMSREVNKIPRRITATWPAARARMDIDVQYVDINEVIEPDTFVFSGKRRVSVVDLEGGIQPDVTPPLERKLLR